MPEQRTGFFLARVAHLRGNLDAAETGYTNAIRYLQDTANVRGQTYFMRFQALVLARLRRFDEAEETALKSLAIAETGNHPDLAEYAREVLARVYWERRKLPEALREFNMTLKWRSGRGWGCSRRMRCSAWRGPGPDRD